MKHNQVALLTFLLAGLCLMPAGAHANPAQPATSPTERRASLVVQFGDGSHIARCMAFSEESISGLDLLTRSGLQVVTWGQAVCRIDKDGCDHPAVTCFCQCTRNPCSYWSYWLWREGRWVYSPVGAGDHRVHDGDVDAWVWGDGRSPPRLTAVESICLQAGTPMGAPDDAAASGRASAGSPATSPSLAGRQGPPLGQYVVFGAVLVLFMGAVWLARSRQKT